jgi:hypothetical protein
MEIEDRTHRLFLLRTRITSTLNTLLPTTFPIAMGDIPTLRASRRAPDTSASAPATSSASPAASKRSVIDHPEASGTNCTRPSPRTSQR